MSRILIDMVERHADEAAFLWEHRRRASRSPRFDLRGLAAMDSRLDAHLDGLLVAGEAGLRVCLEAVGPGGAGELFAASFIAGERGDAMAMAQLIVAAEKVPGGDEAVISALGWMSPERADKALTELVAPECPPNLQRLGIAGRAVRREDPGAALERATRSPHPGLRGRALRAAGELGRRDLRPALTLEACERADDEASPWAAWSAALMGDDRAVPALWRAVERVGPAAAEACALAVRCVDGAWAAARLAELARSPDYLPAALAGAAARGDPACVPWVLDVIESHPDLARRAAWVYATVTGAALEAPLVTRTRAPEDPPDDLIERLEADPFEHLAAPDPAAMRSHWAQVSPGFRKGERRLGGRPIEPAWLAECLRAGAQPWRESASVELARASTSGPLFPVRAPGFRQRRTLRDG